MDFSTEFVAFRERLLAAQDRAFAAELNACVAGRTAAMFSRFSVNTERKLFGMVPTGNHTHAHEYRLLFGVPRLDAAGLLDWWQYAGQAERALVQPDPSHDFSIVSLLLAAGELEPAVPKQLRQLTGGRDFSGSGQGWSSIRLAVIDLSARKLYTNRMGNPLKNVIKPVL